MEAARKSDAGLPREVLGIWALVLLTAAEVLATYARTPVRHLYHVSGSGPAAAAGRVLVLSNFPDALLALGVLAVVAAVSGRRVRALAAVAAVLSAGVVWPGVVYEPDLDAKPVNAIPAVGVALTLVLTAVAARRALVPPRRVPGDRTRVLVAALLLAVSLPWLAADLGFAIGDVPVVGGLFVSEESWAPFGRARLHPGVHVGHHHGADGLLLALAALLFARGLGTLPRGRLRAVLGGYVAVMLAYGLANVLNDAWYEQVVKRGLVGWAVPNMVLPSLNLPWLLLLLAAAAAWPVLAFRPARGEHVPARWTRPAWVPALALAVAALLAVGATSGGGAARSTPPARTGTGAVVFSMSPGYHAHLYTVGADGRDLRRLTRGDANELAPAVSGDGRIVYQANPDGNWDLFLLDGRGTVTRLTDDSADEGEPAWSPDGRRIAFVRDGDLYVMAADGGDVRKLADDAEWPAWAPSRHELAFSSDRDGDFDVYAIADDGTAPVRMTSDEHDDRRPVWSADGARVAFESDRTGRWHLYALRAGSGGVVALTNGAADDFAPAWSRDGRRLVFLSDRDGNDQLYAARADGSGVKRLTSGQADKDTPAWRR